jgi:hypothetical protein
MGSGLNKVRGRIGYCTRPFYKEFKKKYPNTTVTYEQYKDIILNSNDRIRHYILDNQTGFKLPLSMGYIGITKFKQKSKYIVPDWINCVKQQRYVPLLNFHSFGYMFKIKFFRNFRLRPIFVYDFKAHRTLNRELASLIKSGKQDYLPLDNSYFTKSFKIEKLLNYTETDG